jgi:lipoprotein-anchoring transpeptidase ErfK/SrfK
LTDYAVFAERVRRKTGLSFVDAFVARDGDFERRFAVTVDMRLVPATKVKPDTASMFHGTEVSDRLVMPFAFVNQRSASAWKLIKNQDLAEATDPVPLRAIVPLSGNARIKQGKRFYQTRGDATRWLRADDLSVVSAPPAWPEAAGKGQKWIDVSLVQQTLVLYEGKRAVYATLVSTGQDRLGDPKTQKATPRGEFRIRSKHIAAAMDSEENSTVLGGARETSTGKVGSDATATIERLQKAERDGARLDADDRRRLENIQKGRHPEYGITMRRGSQNFELRDVPWIQYFASGYAIHGAYWHDVFGIPRSHGCINLSPIDARIAFLWTEPALPEGWHGMNVGAETGEGTVVIVRE